MKEAVISLAKKLNLLYNNSNNITINSYVSFTELLKEDH